MSADRRWALIRFLLTTIALFIVWILFTANLDVFSLTAGLSGSFFISALTYDVFIARHQANLRFILPQPFSLVVYLIMMIIFLYQSSIKMLLAVISGEANPRIVHFHTTLHSDLGRMVLANSITLTPGTLTLDLNDDHLTVHWFFSTTAHAKASGEIVKGSIEKLIKRVWL